MCLSSHESGVALIFDDLEALAAAGKVVRMHVALSAIALLISTGARLPHPWAWRQTVLRARAEHALSPETRAT